VTISRNLSSIPNTITANTIIDSTGNTVPISTVVQGTAKAWVSYNASTTTIRSSFNCSSVTYVSATNYIFNFTNPMPNATYATLSTTGGTTNNYALSPWTSIVATSNTQFGFTLNGSVNPTFLSVAVFSS